MSILLDIRLQRRQTRGMLVNLRGILIQRVLNTSRVILEIWPVIMLPYLNFAHGFSRLEENKLTNHRSIHYILIRIENAIAFQNQAIDTEYSEYFAGHTRNLASHHGAIFEFCSWFFQTLRRISSIIIAVYAIF